MIRFGRVVVAIFIQLLLTDNVGIGTAAPAAPLDIQIANSSSVAARITGGNKLQFLNASNNTNSNIYNNGASGVAQMAFQIAGSTKGNFK